MDTDNHVWLTAEGRHKYGKDANVKKVSKETVHTINTSVVGQTHGLLGQTLHNREYPMHERDMKYIEGTLEAYVVADGLFGNKFKFNQYGQF